MPRLCQFLLFLLICAAAQAQTHALLVGVSGYPSLPISRQLQGPANDVKLLRDALLQSGVRKPNMTVLADQVQDSQGLPTRQAIFSAFGRLVQSAKSGDWVLLYFSGHGSQQPQSAGANYLEPDGLDEIFLPYDVERWDGRIGRVNGAIIDDEIHDFLQRFKAKGVSVWVVFDTCHSGDMSRVAATGDDVPKSRAVPASALGVPRELLKKAEQRYQSKPASRSVKGETGLIEFYASQSDELTTEETLPTNDGRRRQGLFTWNLAAALQTKPVSFAELAGRIATRYRDDRRPFPTPMFRGELQTKFPISP